MLGVAEETEQLTSDRHRLGRPRRLAGELAEASAAVDEPRVVRGVAERAGAPPTPRAQHPPVGTPEMIEQESRDLDGSFRPVVPFGGGPGLGKGRAHHRVPLRDDLVVETRSDASGPRVQQPGAGGLDPRRPKQVAAPGAVQNCPTLEVALRGDAVPRGRLCAQSRSEQRCQLLARPQVVAALLTF